MAEQALWHLKRVSLAIPVPSVAPLRARAWMVAPPLLFGLVGALIATHVQGSTWRSKAEVTGVQGFSAALPQPQAGADPKLFIESLASIARFPALAARVVHDAGVPGISAAEFLRHSSAKPVSNASAVSLSVTYDRRAAAVRLASAYGADVGHYQRRFEAENRQKVLATLETEIRRQRGTRLARSPGYLAMRQQLLWVRTYQLSQVSVATPTRASSFRPHALRNGLVGGALGVLLGVALVLGVAARRRRGN